MNDPSQIMMNRGYQGWPAAPPHPVPVPVPVPPEMSMGGYPNPAPQLPPLFLAGAKPQGRWKGKKGGDKRRKDTGTPALGLGGGAGGYKPPALHELQSQNRAKARRFYPNKKKFGGGGGGGRFAPYAPRNTTSFIIRAKKSGGIASLVSPCPVTPAILPTPMFSPSREVLVDMAKEEWGVDGYGTMKGLIRLRSPGHEHELREDREDDGLDEDEDGSSESDVEEHLEVERRLDHDVSRFEMLYPSFPDEHANLLENRVDDQDTHISQLEEENLTLKERLFLMETELADLRRRLQTLETESRAKEEGNNNEEGSENEGAGDVCSEKSVGDGDGEVGDAD